MSIAPDDVTSPASSEDRHAPLTTQHLAVGDGHEVYVETIGRAGGIPAVYLHGGPGSGCQPDHRRLFDPDRFHALLFDQRGAGRSRPKGSRTANTLPHLIADMEMIRAQFGFDKWMVIGGSWGATLALAYAQAHPERVSGLVLRATFLGTRAELDDAFCNALPRHYPGLHDDFLSLLAPDERSTLLEAYWRRLLDPDPAVHGPAARAWFGTESILSSITPGRARLELDAMANSTRPLPATPRIEAHYFHNDCFMLPGQLLANVHRMQHIPGIMIQGRFDLLCPPATSYALAAIWPAAEIRVIEGAGHSLYDPGVRDGVAQAITDMAAIQATGSPTKHAAV